MTKGNRDQWIRDHLPAVLVVLIPLWFLGCRESQWVDVRNHYASEMAGISSMMRMEPPTPAMAPCRLGRAVQVGIIQARSGYGVGPFGSWRDLLALDPTRVVYHEDAPTLANGPSNPKDGEVHIWIEQTDYPRGTNQFVNLTCWDKGGWTPLWEGRHYKYRTTRSSPVLSPGSKVFSDSFSMMQVIPIAEWCVGTGRLADWPRNEEDWATCLDNPEIGAAVFTDKRLRHDLWRLAHFTPQMGD